MSKLKYFDGTNWNEVGGNITGDTLPIGAIVPFGGWDAPTGWLICDGTLLNKTAYPELFNAIGYSFGGEEGGSTFGLPDLRGRVPLGLKETDTDFNGMGLTGGEKKHTLTTNEMPSHNHMGKIYSRNYNDNKSLPYNRAYARSFADVTAGWHFTTTGETTGQIVDTIETGNSGGGQAHNNLQPYQTVNYIIKATQSAGLIANVSNIYSTSETDTYSCDYINNKITGTQLWVNPSLGAAFGAQTISVDLSPYKYIELVYYRFPAATTPMFRIFTRVGDISQLNYCDYDQSTARAWIREFEVKSTGIEFKIATINGTTDNGGLVPGKIIGHK